MTEFHQKTQFQYFYSSTHSEKYWAAIYVNIIIVNLDNGSHFYKMLVAISVKHVYEYYEVR